MNEQKLAEISLAFRNNMVSLKFASGPVPLTKNDIKTYFLSCVEEPSDEQVDVSLKKMLQYGYLKQHQTGLYHFPVGEKYSNIGEENNPWLGWH